MDLSLGGFMLPAIDLPIVSIKAYAQESSTVNTSPKSDRVIEVGVLSDRGEEQTIAKWQPTMDYLTRKIPGYTFKILWSSGSSNSDYDCNFETTTEVGSSVEGSWSRGSWQYRTYHAGTGK